MAQAENSSEGPRQLSDDERRELAGQLDVKSLAGKSRSLGFKLRGGELTEGAVVAEIPESLQGAALSVCGVKAFMIDERREFTRSDGSKETVDCASIAALEIVDAPVHVHAGTLEMYKILGGEGRMVLGDKVIDVKKGDVIMIPPGVEHGLVSSTADKPPNEQKPVNVLLMFTPGIAPKEKPEFRDERIVHERTSDRITQLSA